MIFETALQQFPCKPKETLILFVFDRIALSYELIVVSTEEGLQLLRQQKRRSGESEHSGGSSTQSSSDPLSGLIYRVMGIDSMLGAAKVQTEN